MADNFYTYLTEQGIIVPDTSIIQAAVEAEMRLIFGDDIDLTPETPQGRLVEVLTAERAGVLGINAANASQMNLEYATGLFLDAIGSLFGVARIGKTKSRVSATLAGVAGTVITAGSIAKTTAGDEFYLVNTVTLPVISADFLSVEYGAIPCEVATLTNIVSSVVGWETITNSAEPNPFGNDDESDASYRVRIKASRYSGTGFISDVASALNKVADVVSSFAYDNGEAIPVTYDGIVIAAHSLVALVDGGVDADVAQAIYEKKSAGCGYTKIDGTGTVTISSANPATGGTVTIGGQVYTFRTSLTTSPSTIPYEVLIAGTLTDTAKNLTLAVNGGAGAGTNYSTGTVANLSVAATDGSAGVVNLTGGRYGVVLCSDTATNTVSAVSKLPLTVVKYIEDGDYGISYPVSFNRPEEVQIDVEVTLRSGDFSEADMTTQVKDAISQWALGEVEGVDGLSIGQDVSPFEIASAITILVPSPYIKLIRICVHGGSLATSELTMYSYQVARIIPANITVLYV